MSSSFQFHFQLFLIYPTEDLCTAGCTLPMTLFGLSLTYGLSRQSVFLNGSRKRDYGLHGLVVW